MQHKPETSDASIPSDSVQADSAQADATATNSAASPQTDFDDATIPTGGLVDDTSTRVASLETELAEAKQAVLYARAEAENIRRRATDDVQKASRFAVEKFASSLLSVKDSLEAALQSDSTNAQALREGVELTLKQLESAFDSAQIHAEDPVGQKFDPNRHQAMSMVDSELPANTVVAVLQKGYTLHERVLRPALVTVAKSD